MTNEECFAAWAPSSALWSPWAKPVLFAQFLQVLAPPEGPVATALPSWVPEARAGAGGHAIIVNLPGGDSVTIGLALARRGYRPVPLYNGNLGHGTRTVVPTDNIARHLRVGAVQLGEIRLPDDAPPAFLLDALRLRGVPAPGNFDNRWAALPQDFPSATFLQAHGIRDVLLLEQDDVVDQDLAHVLLRWQQAGIRLRQGHPGRDAAPRDLTVAPPSSFRRAWYRVIALLGLRRSNVGGFGAMVPEPGSGGFGG